MRRLSHPFAILLLASTLVAVPATRAGANGTSAVRAAPPSKAARERRMKAVVHTWSERLNANDNAGVARLFALPSAVIQGPYAYRFNTRKQIAIWHSSLPCSGRIEWITIQGRFATAVFRLGNRGKTRCDGPGTLAAARFEIVDGKIRTWMQVGVPERPADDGALVA